MGTRFQDERLQFEDELSHIIEQHVESLGETTVSEVLETLSTRIEKHTAPKTVVRTSSSSTPRVVVKFSDPHSLEEMLSKLDKDGVLQLPTAPQLSPNCEVCVKIMATGVVDAQVMLGRVVHQDPHHVWIHLVGLDADTRQELRQWPEQMVGEGRSVPPRTASLAEFSAVEATPARPAPAPSPPEQRNEWQPLDLRPAQAVITERWSLAEVDLDEVFVMLARRNARGVLTLLGRGSRLDLVLWEGDVHAVEATPTDSCPRLSELLSQTGRISQAQAQRVRQEARCNGVTEAKIILDKAGPSARSGVLKSVRAYLGRLLRTLRSDRFDRAQFVELDELPVAVAHVGVSLLAMVFQRHKFRSGWLDSTAVADANASGFEGMIVAAKRCAPVCTSQLGLSVAERQFYDLALHQRASFSQITACSLLAPTATTRFLAALDYIGALDVEINDLTQPTEINEQIRYARTLEHLQNMERKLARNDPYELLDLHWSSYDGLTESRARHLLDSFKMIQQPLGLSRSERLRLRDCREGVRCALLALANPEGRASCRDRLASTKEQQRWVEELETCLESADRRGLRDCALDLCQRLLELRPTHKRAGRLLPRLLAAASPSRPASHRSSFPRRSSPT